MKRYIFCSILFVFISAVSYASSQKNSIIITRQDDETIYKYWLWKELSSQYGDSHFRSFLNHSVTYALRTIFLPDPKPCTKLFGLMKSSPKIFSLAAVMLKQALINIKKLEEEKNIGELGR